MNLLLLLPVLIPLGSIVLLLFLRGLLRTQQMLGLVSTLGQLVVALILLVHVYSSGIQVTQPGNWPAPFGITFVADLFSAIMLVLSAIIGVVVTLYSISSLEKSRQQFSYYPLMNALLMGVNGAFLTGDVFNLYVWFEVMILASFVLLTMGGHKKQMDGAVKYVTMNLIASMMFLAGIGLLYGKTGTLNMADLAVKLTGSDESILINSSAMLFFVAFGIKAAVFPFFFWLPASYHTPPVAITALFSGLLTKVGVYAMIRFFTLFFVQNQHFWHPLLLTIAGLTMVVGVLTAASQYEMRRILSFHIISQIGYMVMGLGLFTVLGIAGAIYFMAHNIFAKTNMFLVSGIVHRLRGTYDLKVLGGLYKNYPLVAVLFVIPAMALAGVPPLSGFIGKLVLIYAGFEDSQYFITAVSILVGLITLFSMVKIWNEGFWKKNAEDTHQADSSVPAGMLIPAGILALLTILLGVGAEPVIKITMQAAEQLMHPEAYIQAVLNP